MRGGWRASNQALSALVAKESKEPAAIMPTNSQTPVRPYELLQASKLCRNGFMFFCMSKGMGVRELRLMQKLYHMEVAPLNFVMDKALKYTILDMFYGGTTPEELKETFNNLSRQNIQPIVDYSPEGGAALTSEYFDKVAAEIVEVAGKISLLRRGDTPPSMALKIPARPDVMERISNHLKGGVILNPDDAKEWQKIQLRTMEIFKAAHESGVEILVDAEQTTINPAIDELCNIARSSSYGGITETVQCYLKNSPERMAELLKNGVGVKIVRGAYVTFERERAGRLGKDSPVFSTKEEVDKNYDKLVQKAIESVTGGKVIVATHNTESAQLAAKLSVSYPGKDITLAYLKGMPFAPPSSMKCACYLPIVMSPEQIRSTLEYLTRRAEENSFEVGRRGGKAVSDELLERALTGYVTKVEQARAATGLPGSCEPKAVCTEFGERANSSVGLSR